MEDKIFQQTPATEVKKSRKGFIAALALLLIVLLSLWLTVFFIGQRTSFFGRAKTVSSGEIALENSYVFASPLSARADGKEKIRITVFVLDSQGRGVYGQSVFLSRDERIEVRDVQVTTDNLGRTIFDISTLSPADYFLEALVDNQILPQKVKVNFH